LSDSDETAELPSALDFTPLRAVLWMLGAFSVMVTLALVLMVLSPESRNDLVALGFVSAAAFVLVAALLVGRYPGGPRLAHAIGLRPVHPLSLILAFCAGALAQIPADFIQRAVDRLWPSDVAALAAREKMLEADSWSHGLALVFVIACVVPATEEVFFRGAVYGALRRGRASAWQSAWVAGLGFTLCHFNARLLLPLAFVAGILGFLRAASGSLWPSILGHMGFNTVAMLTSVGGVAFLDGPPLSFGLGASALLVALLLAFVSFVASREDNAKYRAEDAEVSSLEPTNGGM
jgi:membrane protease YdiL (CAAX protease family)